MSPIDENPFPFSVTAWPIPASLLFIPDEADLQRAAGILRCWLTAPSYVAAQRLLLGDPTLSPTRALRRAAHWLRTATQQDIDALAGTAPEDLTVLRGGTRVVRDSLRSAAIAPPPVDDATRSPLTEQWQQLGLPSIHQVYDSDDPDHPYSHAYYWGAFIEYGWE